MKAPDRGIRIAQFITGILLMAGAWPVAFVAAVMAGGGHSSPFGHRPVEAAFGIALLGIPALLFLLGGALVRAGLTGRHRLAARLAVLIPLDAAIAAAALWMINQPDLPVMMPAPVSNAAGAGPMGQPAVAVPACYPGRGCTSESRPMGVERR
jgi:hypothetical protein